MRSLLSFVGRLALATFLLVLPAVVPLGPFLAHAQEAAAPATDGGGLAGGIILALADVAVSVILSLWAWFKSHAAQSEAKWDDEAVSYVEKLAQGVVDRGKPPGAR